MILASLIVYALTEMERIALASLAGTIIAAALAASALRASANRKRSLREIIHQATGTTNGHEEQDPGGTLRDLVLEAIAVAGRAEARATSAEEKAQRCLVVVAGHDHRLVHLEALCQHRNLVALTRSSDRAEYRCIDCRHTIVVFDPS